MACYHPLSAFQLDTGEVVFAERGRIRRELTLPCGRCIGCRLVRSRSWAIRCMHESSMHDLSSFVTLTYSDEFYSPSLNYVDFQLFMKRLRRRLGPTRFFACGEYGDEYQRPHFHALLFGCSFTDRKILAKDLYRSATLEELWPKGHCSIGSVTFQSAAYCARYATKKITGPLAAEHYSRVHLSTGEIVQVEPEFAHMSLKPAIGKTWFQRYWRDVYAARDGVVVDGKVLPAPKFYDRLLEATCPDLKYEKDYDRYVSSEQFAIDCTPERLLAREIVAKARMITYKENLR